MGKKSEYGLTGTQGVSMLTNLNCRKIGVHTLENEHLLALWLYGHLYGVQVYISSETLFE